MEEITIFLKDLITKSGSKNLLFKRNLIKEYLQVVVLNYIYSHPVYNQLVFYGGSCLSHCFGLPRLSEDLDFIDLGKSVHLSRLSKDLESYFKKETDLDLITKVQKFRVYLKFPILFELGLAKEEESNLLFLKIETYKISDLRKNTSPERME